MKKLVAVLLLVCSIAALAFAFGGKQTASYLRVHIRADSNEAAAQAVKYEVRDAVVRYLTPVVAECESKQEAMDAVRARLREIEAVATQTLSLRGFSYGARAKLCREQFPTRVYDGATLKAGVYDALILELGSGEGDNWWCVVYPPLCFTSGNGNVVYRSKIAEIIKKFFEKNQDQAR